MLELSKPRNENTNILFPLDVAVQDMWYNPVIFFLLSAQIIPTLVLAQISPVTYFVPNPTWYFTFNLIPIYPQCLPICNTLPLSCVSHGTVSITYDFDNF